MGAELSGAVAAVEDSSLLEEEAAAEEDALEAALLQIYREFIDTKKRCGEADVVAYDRFAEKLRENRRQLMERFGCKDVKFIVYVKEGKAAVKASPVKA